MDSEIISHFSARETRNNDAFADGMEVCVPLTAALVDIPNFPQLVCSAVKILKSKLQTGLALPTQLGRLLLSRRDGSERMSVPLIFAPNSLNLQVLSDQLLLPLACRPPPPESPAREPPASRCTRRAHLMGLL